LTARTLETAGIAPAVIGSALDIVTPCGVPRYLFTDLPLGNSLGRPFQREMQYHTVETGLALVESTDGPCVVISDLRWSDDDGWKLNYMKIDDSNREELRRMGDENRRRRKQQKAQGLRRS